MVSHTAGTLSPPKQYLIRNRVPNNVKFVIDDANEEDWMLDPMDYIHTRILLGCFEVMNHFLIAGSDFMEPRGRSTGCSAVKASRNVSTLASRSVLTR